MTYNLFREIYWCTDRSDKNVGICNLVVENESNRNNTLFDIISSVYLDFNHSYLLNHHFQNYWIYRCTNKFSGTNCMLLLTVNRCLLLLNLIANHVQIQVDCDYCKISGILDPLQWIFLVSCHIISENKWGNFFINRYSLFYNFHYFTKYEW